VQGISQLQCLTSLTLRGRICDGQVLKATSCLTALQHLELCSLVKPCRDVGGLSVSSFAGFPASLTSLEVALKGPHNIRPLELSHLTALQEFKLQHQGSITASVLSGKSALRKLVLVGSQLLPAAGPALGLQPFCELTRLEHLELAVAFEGEDVWMCCSKTWPPATSVAVPACVLHTPA
jgi:hypothetical protein